MENKGFTLVYFPWDDMGGETLKLPGDSKLRKKRMTFYRKYMNQVQSGWKKNYRLYL